MDRIHTRLNINRNTFPGPEFEIQRRIDFIKRQLKKVGLKKLLLGISGGIDSATCGRLAQLAVEQLNQEENSSEHQFVAVRLPYSIQAERFIKSIRR
jgi:NAD+ synthase